MKRLAMIGVAGLLALPAQAEDFTGRGWLLVCGDEGCFVNAAGTNLWVPADGSAAEASLRGLEPLSAVEVSGDLSDIGDSSATLALRDVVLIDTPDEGNLREIQGRWRPLGEATPFHIEILGVDWSEMSMEEELSRAMMVLGPACASGVEPGGTAISLYPYGGDPEAIACWQIEYLDDRTLVLRDFMGDQGAVEFERLLD